MTPLRVVLADDHSLVRAGIRALLEKIPDVEVVGEASEGREAIALLKALLPDVAMLDIAMGGLNGIEVAARIAKECPTVKVMILSMHANEEYVMRAMVSGAVATLLKDAAVAELELALKAVVRGGTYLSPVVSRHVIDMYVARVGGAPNGPLTARQLEILRFVAMGRSTKEIAFELNISTKTVETHRAQLMERLDIHDIAGLVKYAIRAGVIPPEH